MKAYLVKRYSAVGAHLTDVTKPSPKSDEVLLRVCAASINPLDLMVQRGDFRLLLPYRRPFVLGHDVAGIVEAIGSDVDAFAVGDAVYGRLQDLHIGTFADFVAAKAEDLAPKPLKLSMEEAAAVPLVALAAWQLLVVEAQAKPGQSILVHAGAGGLGSTIVQLAKHLRLNVSATVSAKDIDKVRQLGASRTFDYTREDFSATKDRFDIIVDSLGGMNLKKSFRVAAKGGCVFSVVGPPDSAFASRLRRPFLRPLMFLLSLGSRRSARKAGCSYKFFFMHASGTHLRLLAALYDAGQLCSVIDRVYSFSAITEAMTVLQAGKAKGKLVLTWGKAAPSTEPIETSFDEG